MTTDLTIYTDGGADPNPGPGGWGVVLVEPDGSVSELWGSEAETTNNRMELTAAIRALEALAERGSVRTIEMVTDSQYLKQGVTSWMKGWIARGWRLKNGDPVKNADLWKRLAPLVASYRLTWRWVRGHTGDRYNERADQLAARGIAEIRGETPPEPAFATGADGLTEVYLKVSGRGGWAAAIKSGDDEELIGGAIAGVTANCLDVLAAAEILERLPAGPVVLHCGSDYLRNGASQWIHGWRRRRWKTHEGQPVKNRDAWQRLERAMAGRRISWPKPDAEIKAKLKALETIARTEAERT